MSKHSKSQVPRGRKVPKLEELKTFFIICEGTVTETNYFHSFKVIGLKIVPIGTGYNTISLVNYVLEVYKQEIKEHEVWCVFDRDDFPPNDFNSAVAKAMSHGINVAYTNQAFELWYLLHFDFHTSDIHRSEYEDKLKLKLGRKYQKNDPTMYETLFVRQNTAITNAKRLMSQYSEAISYVNRAPATTVHELVESLNIARAKLRRNSF
jgi:hypothetical protein